MAIEAETIAVAAPKVSSRVLGEKVRNGPSRSTYQVQADEALDKVSPYPHMQELQLGLRRVCCCPTILTFVTIRH